MVPADKQGFGFTKMLMVEYMVIRYILDYTYQQGELANMIKEMLKTPIGAIDILVNNANASISMAELEKTDRRFRVDGRYQVNIDVNNTGNSAWIDCLLNNKNQIAGGIESGEGMEMISFQCNEVKLSIGTISGLPGIKYCYLNNGIRLEFDSNIGAQERQIQFFIAWLKINNPEREQIFTWFAADPTLA